MQPQDDPPAQHGCSLTSLLTLLFMVAGGVVGYSVGAHHGIVGRLLGALGGAFAGVVATGLLFAFVALLIVAFGGRDTPDDREESPDNHPSTPGR